MGRRSTVTSGVRFVAASLALTAGVLFGLPVDADAAAPDPAVDSAVVMSAEPMLGGSFRPGSWAAFRVLVENGGPAVAGELRISATTDGSSTFGRRVELPTGARQEHILYAQTAFFGNRFEISLVSGSSLLASATVAIDVNESEGLGIFVVAERPEGLVALIRTAVSAAGWPAPEVVAIAPEDLPPRVDAWASVDLLVWHDVESNRLDADRVGALRTWTLSGGHMVIAGGTTGASMFGSFPPEMLPFRPTSVVDVPLTDLEAALGTLPAGAFPVPALTGTLERGTGVAQSGDAVIAARTSYGQGTVVLIGVDPSTSWLAAMPTASRLWSAGIPTRMVVFDSLSVPDDAFLVDALGNLPAVQLPPFDQLVLLIVAYVMAIGPLNYLVLRRRDRREWAWVTMPLTIVLFAVGAYLSGSLAKGTNVVVNELAIVHGSPETDRGLAQVYVGIYSPSRADFDVRVGGDALLSGPAGTNWEAPQRAQRPVDVLLGDPATLRGYGVGFGALRAFRAQAQVATPRVDAALTLGEGAIDGSVTNSSDVALSAVSVVYGDDALSLGDLAPGESRPVHVDLGSDRFMPLADRLFPLVGGDADTVRATAARRAVIRHLAGGWEEFPAASRSRVFAAGPVILAWQSGATLDIDVGTAAEHVGERVFVLPARVALTGPQIFTGGVIQQAITSVDAVEGFVDGKILSLGRGTIAAEFWPLGVDSSFDVTGLSLRLSVERPASPTATGDELAPLPESEQPDPEAPLAADPRPADGESGAPRIQLFDRVAGTWVEFEPVGFSRSYVIPDPGRYVDRSAVLRVRFVVRDRVEFSQFSLGVRLEGTFE